MLPLGTNGACAYFYYNNYLNWEVIAMENKQYDNFIFYGSIRKTMETLPEQYRDRYLKAVIIYGTESIVLEEDPIILALLQSLAPNIENAKTQYLVRKAKKQLNMQNDLGKEGIENLKRVVDENRKLKMLNKNTEQKNTEPKSDSGNQGKYGPSLRR